ncbi:MAG: ATP-binding protein [Ahrensia sp.]|nr:ATP-binding protein [Ahrensia sp.]
MIEDTAGLFSAKAREKGLAIGLVSGPQLAAKFIGDPTRLGQIISNLVNNALKFTSEGGVTLCVNALPADNGHQQIRLCVTDTGIGIESDKLGTIFEQFSQADQSTTRNFGGTGLGLSIAKRLAEAMNGSIHVESRIGVGTAFYVDLTLPVFEPAPELILPNCDIYVAIEHESPVMQASMVDMVSAWGLRAAKAEERTGQKLDLLFTTPSAPKNDNHRFGAVASIDTIAMRDYGDDTDMGDIGQNPLQNYRCRPHQTICARSSRA